MFLSHRGVLLSVLAVVFLFLTTGCNPREDVSATEVAQPALDVASATPKRKQVTKNFQYTAICNEECRISWMDSRGVTQRENVRQGFVQRVELKSGQIARIGITTQDGSLVLCRINELERNAQGELFAPGEPLRYNEGKGRAFCEYTVIYE